MCFSCPVCRYVQTPETIPDNQCQECHSSESLWICLICGYVGCGRYVQGHAYKYLLGLSTRPFTDVLMTLPF